jgi:thiol-disulfide isomerase/thioredoxin
MCLLIQLFAIQRVGLHLLSKQIQIGKPLPKLEVYNEADERITLKNDSGILLNDSGFLLIDFWASWCVPCLIQLDKLNDLVVKQKMQHIKIVDVSIDDSKNRWLNALEKDKFNWQHTWVGADKNLKEKIISTFQVYSIPASFLVDKNGIVISINPTEEEIMVLKKL